MPRRLLVSLFAVALTLSVVAIGAHTVRADPRDFRLTNGSSIIITHVYVSPSDENNWGDDILGEDVLVQGDTVTISFQGFNGDSTCLYDIMVRGQNGEQGFLYKVDLCSTTDVTFYDS